MKSRIRIRPRIWLALAKPLARLGWVPLSLVFRKRRSPERSLPGTTGAPVSLLNVLSFLSQINHHPTNELRQFFAGSIQHHHWFLNRAAAQNSTSMKGTRHPEASAFHELHRERIVETLFRSSALRESRQSFTATRYFQEITKQQAQLGPPAAWSAESPLAAPAQRVLGTPEPLRQRVFGSSSPLFMGQQEVPGKNPRLTLQAAVEDRLIPRFRKADPPPAPASIAAWTIPAVQQVWREPPRALRGAATETGRLPSAAQDRTTDQPSHHKAESLPPVPASAALSGKVEGPTMERIAEDVMKRIERHLRIERERRGM